MGTQYSERAQTTPSPPSGAERVGVRWGIPERWLTPTSPSQRSTLGPSLSPLKGGEGSYRCAARAVFVHLEVAPSGAQ
jgi:hypothetical protein